MDPGPSLQTAETSSSHIVFSLQPFSTSGSLEAHNEFLFVSVHNHSPDRMNPLSSSQSAKLPDCVPNIHSAHQLITTECYNQIINESFDKEINIPPSKTANLGFHVSAWSDA